MKKIIIGYVAGLLTFAILIGGAVYAEGVRKSIDVTSGDVKIYVSDEPLAMKDARGNAVETFIYNDSVYVPVRAIANAMLGTVEWNNDERAVYLYTFLDSFAVYELE